MPPIIPQHITVSVTETASYRRLVKFLCDVDHVAHRNLDDELCGMVERCRDDLLRARAQKGESDG